MFGIRVHVEHNMNIYPDQALALSHEGLTLAQELAHPRSLAMALDYAAMLHQFRQERDAVDARTAAAVALCAEQGFAYDLAWGTTMQGWARTVPGAGTRRASPSSAVGSPPCGPRGPPLRLPYYLALLAEACGHTGRAAEGVTLLAEALAHAHSTGRVLDGGGAASAQGGVAAPSCLPTTTRRRKAVCTRPSPWPATSRRRP